MSIFLLKNKVLGHTLQGGGGKGGGGGGGVAPATQSTVTNTNIPEYARPYVENMLNATQQQLFNIDPNTNQITGFTPYVPYSNDPTAYVAGFSPLQKQAQSAAANLQMPGEYGAASGLTGLAAGSSMGLAGQEAMAGQRLQQQSTNPYAVGAYMNPFIQNALAPAQQLLNQQYGMQGASQQGAATQQGAFGGSRNALMQGLNEQNRMLAQNQLVGNAYQQAYNQALGQMNQVAQTGLAGQQAAMQGIGQTGQLANQLAGIGGQALAAQQGIIGTQTQQGAAQQAQQQQIINQAIQDYATKQQYPLLQLGTMSNMLRGLPMQSQSTQLYQAQPSGVQQAIGLGGTAALLGSAFGGGKKEGGIIGMRKGGKVPGYKYGAVINDEQLQSKARNLNDAQLQQRVADPLVNPNERMIFQGVQADQNRLRQNPTAAAALQQAAMPPQPQMNPQAMEQARLSGLGAAGGPAFNSQGFAGGGIIAFANQGLVPDPTTPEDFANRRQGMMERLGFSAGPSEEEKALAESYKNRATDKTNLDRALKLAGAKTLADFGSIGAPGGTVQALNMALSKNIPNLASAFDAQRVAEEAAIKGAADLKASQRKFAAGEVDEAWKDYDSYTKNKTTKEVAQIHAAAAGQAARVDDQAIKSLMQTEGLTYGQAAMRLKGLDIKAQGAQVAAIKNDLAAINATLLTMSKKDPAYAKTVEMRNELTNKLHEISMGGGQQATAQAGAKPATNPDAGGIVDIPGRGKFQQLPNGNYIKVG